ncbi:uncharacterized protein PFL1_04557 [Pseudozyma flocculosa PF-1]|uniref:Uncharacterized protein n=2 Tax=Pseudozyma flocculosa TaxID=84751 RepID=A0A5C3FA17_9BASI|nr:uncharacterized protein PFL1_04557 [Pseudozyma flocculosa PF-1]EPQ27812.1 hypothetical protein PFL1_04557 [Pseudozyma flocculosa PF-1]SPO41060.1 uncharacterized protein PSFLO_06542 [Pseudozyma flocculosa]
MNTLARPLTRTVARSTAVPLLPAPGRLLPPSSVSFSTSSSSSRHRSGLRPTTLGFSFGTGLAASAFIPSSSVSSDDAGATTGTRRYTVASPDESPAGGEVKGSSTIWRKASPTAPRRQTVTLVFLSDEGSKVGLGQMVKSLTGGVGGRAVWQPYIAYFREAGYDALDLNLSSPSSSPTVAELTDELHNQIRLASLQRLPVLFVRDGTLASDVVSEYITPSDANGDQSSWWKKLFSNPANSRPALSGLIVIDAPTAAQEASSKYGTHKKLNVLLVGSNGQAPQDGPTKVRSLVTAGKSDEETIKAIERWLIDSGYEG